MNSFHCKIEGFLTEIHDKVTGKGDNTLDNTRTAMAMAAVDAALEAGGLKLGKYNNLSKDSVPQHTADCEAHVLANHATNVLLARWDSSDGDCGLDALMVNECSATNNKVTRVFA